MDQNQPYDIREKMKLYLERYSEKTTDGKTLFCNRLGDELIRRRVRVSGDPNKKADIAINVINIKPNKAPIQLVRFDGVYFDTQTSYINKNRILSESMRKADGIIYQSEFSKVMCDKYLGVPSCPSQIILNGADPNFYERARPIKRRHKHIFFAMSRWRNFKRLTDTIESFLLADIDDSILYIAGGLSRSGIDLKKYGHHRKLKFLGQINQKIAASYLKVSTAFLHLSWFDSCPNGVVEAVAAGVPVICGNIGGTKEIVGPSGGYVCEIDKPYRLEPVDVYNPPPIDRKKVARKIMDCIKYPPEIIYDHVDIKRVGSLYLKFLREFVEKPKPLLKEKIGFRLRNSSKIVNGKDLISIVVTLYNYKHYIGDLIDSVLKQTYVNWELIIVDDASTDNPEEVLNQYDDDRIRCIKLKENAGYSHAKNVGIRESKGEYIVMIDADDMLTSRSLELRYKALSQSDKLWCHGEAWSLVGDKEISPKYIHRTKLLRNRLIDDGYDLEKEYHMRLIHAQTVMVKKKLHRIVGLYDEDLPCSSDTEMWDRILRLGHMPVSIRYGVSIYRQHGEQMHNSEFKRSVIKEVKQIRHEHTQRRIDEGINENNTLLLKDYKMKMNELVQVHHGDQFGFSRHYMLLYSMVLGLETKLAFEFGAGQSSKVILKALERTGGKLISCDVRDLDTIGIPVEERSDKWEFQQGRSNRVLKKMNSTGFDLVLHDGAHDRATVLSDLKFIIPRMKLNGLLLIHDTEHKYKDILEAVDESLKRIKHQRVELPYGCGLSIIRIKQDFKNGKVELTWKKKKKS